MFSFVFLNTIATPLDQFDIVKIFDSGSYVSFGTYYNFVLGENSFFDLFLIDF